MALKSTSCKHTLNFKFDAGTSRGVLKNKDSWFIKIWDEKEERTFGIGEAAPLKGLSIDYLEDFESRVIKTCDWINKSGYSMEELWIHKNEICEYLPSLNFALETALLDLKQGGGKMIFENDFFCKNTGIDINGLIWMGDRSFMQAQIDQKLKDGYDTLKMKIGAIGVKTELTILAGIREKYSENELTLRVDANGAFEFDEALELLEKLKMLGIHSIEQPIKAGNWKKMAELCKQAAIPVALDEELIGVNKDQQEELLSQIKPHYIILKPTLLGGFEICDSWIDKAEKLNIGWWMTSALESNIGLNAICQYTYEKYNSLPQGLGTGQLYHNNIQSPLEINNGKISLSDNGTWDLSQLNFNN